MVKTPIETTKRRNAKSVKIALKVVEISFFIATSIERYLFFKRY